MDRTETKNEQDNQTGDLFQIQRWADNKNPELASVIPQTNPIEQKQNSKQKIVTADVRLKTLPK